MKRTLSLALVFSLIGFPVVAQNSTDTRSNQMKSADDFMRAEQAYAEQKFDDAIEAYTRFLDENPGHIQALYKRVDLNDGALADYRVYERR